MRHVGSMRQVESIIADKAQDVLSIGAENSVFEALERMAEHNVGALVVLEGEQLLGIISERDCARKVALQDKDLRATKVGDVMTERVFSVGADRPVEEAMELMIKHHIRHLPVTENRRVVGVVSMRDAVREVVSEQRFMIKELETYITRRI
jgi:CBS domain-containing protein